MSLPILSIMDSFRRIMRALRTASRQSEEALGLSVAQLFVLQQLGKQASMSLNELAEHTYSHQSTVSVVVNELAKKGLVLKAPCPRDGRRLTLSLSDQGKKVLGKKAEAIQARFAEGLRRMRVEDQLQLAYLLESFVGHTGLAGEKPHFFFEAENKNNPRKR